jgi:hypothetical protein
MGTAWIDQEKYDAMVGAYRQAPANVRGCARAASVDRRTARKAWHEGWPERGLRPIREVLNEEQQAARARLAKLREAELATLAEQQAGNAQIDRARAEDDAVTSRTEEARMVRASRHNAMGLMASVQRLLRGATKLAERVEEEIATVELKPGAAAALFREIASTTRQANEAARLAQSMERSLLGQPEKWIGLATDMTPEEAMHEVVMAQKALSRAKRRGLVVDTTGEHVHPPAARVSAAPPMGGTCAPVGDPDPPPFGQ